MSLWDGLWLTDISFEQHNALDGLQGGQADEYYHLTLDEYNNLFDASSISITGAGDLLSGQGGDLTASRIFSLSNIDINHDSLFNTHNLTTDIDHDSILNTHNLTSDINHNTIFNTHNLTTDINHLNIQNIGSYAHSAIDTHIDNSNIHFLEGDISHLNISDIGTNTHSQIDTHMALVNEHIDWTNATANFLTSGTLGCGDATINGTGLIDETDVEAFLVRSDGDSGDVFAIDTSSDIITLGTRDNPITMNWLQSWAGSDTDTGVFFDSRVVNFDGCTMQIRISYYGLSNLLVGINPGGIAFYSRYNDAVTFYNNVGTIFNSYDSDENQLGNYYIRAEEDGDLAFGYSSSNEIFAIDYSTRDLKFADGIDFIFGTSTGSKICTSTSQKLGFWNATPITQPTITGANYGNPALVSLLTALENMGLIVDNST